MVLTPLSPPSRLVWIGTDPAVHLARTQIAEAARTDLPVLLLAEPGAGRQLAARLLHALSPRCQGHFVRVCCAALPADRAHALLLGADPPGALAWARGGTLFLDGLDDLPLCLHQLLVPHVPRPSALEGTPARWVAAVSPDVARRVCAGTFCADLYYRLAVVPVVLPPLRDRPRDLPLLAAHFAHQAAVRLGRAPRPLSPEALRLLSLPSWPLNVWQLKRLLEGAVAAGHDRALTLDLLADLLNATLSWPFYPPPLSTWTAPDARFPDPN